MYVCTRAKLENIVCDGGPGIKDWCNCRPYQPETFFLLEVEDVQRIYSTEH